MRARIRRKSGFTLLELMLVMAILVVLASLATYSVLSLQRSALSRAAEAEISTLKDQCKMFKLTVGNFPASLDDLHTLPSGMSQSLWGGPYLEEPLKGDPWRQPYKYSADDANDRVTITSNGPDKQEGTADDIPNPAK